MNAVWHKIFKPLSNMKETSQGKAYIHQHKLYEQSAR